MLHRTQQINVQYIHKPSFGPLVQLEEQVSHKHQVAGSSPAWSMVGYDKILVMTCLLQCGGIGRRLIANVGIRLNNNPSCRFNVDVDVKTQYAESCLVQIQTIAILKQANCFLVGGVSVGQSC